MANIDVDLVLRLGASVAAASRPRSTSELRCSPGEGRRSMPDRDDTGDHGMKRQRCNQELQFEFGRLDALAMAFEEERGRLAIHKQQFPLRMQILDNAIRTVKNTEKRNPSTGNTHVSGFDDTVFADCQRLQYCDIINDASKDCRDYMMNDGILSNVSNNNYMPICYQSNSSQESMEASGAANEERSAQSISHNINDQVSNSGCCNNKDHSYISNEADKKNTTDGMHLRKVRRWWSIELHQKFMEAVSRLGGPKMATPNHILELMNVDGLTSQEVKSHLQKYRKQQAFNVETNEGSRHGQIQQGQSIMKYVWPPYTNGASTLECGYIRCDT